MERNIYISNNVLSLAEYVPDIDDPLTYENWLDPATQEGYNFRMAKSYQEYHEGELHHRLNAVILRNSDRAVIGSITLSPPDSLPDLAINLFRSYRGQGYGTMAFSMALEYCFEEFNFREIYAGCYEHNRVSMRMLEKCGMMPHPEGNCVENHFQTGMPVMQLDFVKYR